MRAALTGNAFQAASRTRKPRAIRSPRNWATYPPRDRDHCERLATLGGMAMASYVEMLTCLEIARDTKTLPADIKKSGLPKQ